jgi:hypothetical protein
MPVGLQGSVKGFACCKRKHHVLWNQPVVRLKPAMLSARHLLQVGVVDTVQICDRRLVPGFVPQTVTEIENAITK